MVHVVYSAFLPPYQFIHVLGFFSISSCDFCSSGSIIQEKRIYNFSFSEAFSLLSTASRYSFVVT